MRRIETVGAVAQRRRDDAGFAAQGLRAAASEALIGVEPCDEAFERAPEGHRVGAGVGMREVGKEARGARGEAGDLAGAEIDQQIELGVGVGEGRRDNSAAGRVVGEVVELFVGREDLEADLDDVMQVHLQRRDGAEAPEDPQDDLPERVHGWEYMPAWGPASSAGCYPPFELGRGLKSGGI